MILVVLEREIAEYTEIAPVGVEQNHSNPENLDDVSLK